MHLQGGLLGARLEMLSRYIVSTILGESSLAKPMQKWVEMYVGCVYDINPQKI